MGRRAELFRLFRAEQHDPVPFYERLAADAVATLPGRLAGARVLDLGCGPGHYTRALRRAGAVVVPLDLDEAEFRAPGGPPGGEVVADARRLPVPDGCFDGVLCSNLLEHTPGANGVIDEMERVLRPGGWGWLSWTNWYSPWGGHAITPFHYLGPRLGPAAYRRLRGEPGKNAPGRALFPVHIGATLRHVRLRPGLRLVAAVPRYYPSQRWILQVPGLREVATWNCLLILERTGGRGRA
ncbi:MAG TPA: methyltransferase domain-containing protein [Acidimicrobiales bacterium]|nr:methyltransferase domain-containing protein [Acidimicrobiales bacterium]